MTNLVPLLSAGATWFIGRDVPQLASGWLIDLVLVVTFLGTLIVVGRTEKQLLGETFRTAQWWRAIRTRLVTRSPILVTTIIAITILPPSFKIGELGILIPSMAIIVFGLTGGGIWLARGVGIAQPASSRLQHIVAAASTRMGTKPRSVYEMDSSAANAVALPIWGIVVVDRPALEVLSDEELISVCVHELAHLTEHWAVRLSHLVTGSLLLLYIIMVHQICTTLGPNGFWVSLLGVILMLFPAQRLGRRMEERADAAGRAHQGDEGTYARALARLYERNLTPAVMSGQRRRHPDLYDRLIAAGFQPPYPRPKPPSNTGKRWALRMGLAVCITLYGALYGGLSAAGFKSARIADKAVASGFSIYPHTEAFRSYLSFQTNAVSNFQHTNFLATSVFPNGGRSAFEYSVAENGHEDVCRNSREWAIIQVRFVHGKHLSRTDIEGLHSAIRDLPTHSVFPPLNRLVIVSFRDGTNWVTRTYDNEDIPKPVQQIYHIIGGRLKIQQTK